MDRKSAKFLKAKAVKTLTSRINITSLPALCCLILGCLNIFFLKWEVLDNVTLNQTAEDLQPELVCFSAISMFRVSILLL